MFAPLTGKLSITLKRAKDLRKTQMLGKQDPYVEVKFAGQKKKTKTHTDGDRFPVWDSTIEFKCQSVKDFTIKFSVWNKNLATLDDSIGVLQIPVLVLLSNPSVWLPLYRHEDHRTECGKILVETKFEGSGGVPVRQHSNFGLISARYGLGNVNVNVLPFVQSIVRDLKLVIPPNVDLSEIFKMDPISGHTDKSLFITYLLGDGKTSNGIHIPESGRRQETVVQLADFSSRQQEQGVAMKAAESQRLKHQAAEVKALQEQAQAEAKKEAELRKSSEASLEAVKQMAMAQEARLKAEIQHLHNMLCEEAKTVKALKDRNQLLMSQIQSLKAENKLAKVIPPKGQVCYLDSVEHKRTMQNNSSNKPEAPNDNHDAWEAHEIFPSNDGGYIIKSLKTGNHLSCNPGNHELRYENQNQGLWESWDIERKSGVYYFVSRSCGRTLQCTPQGQVRCENNNRGPWEAWTISS
uniref:C2 domain-containing protein n=1 Tax=Amorphochlora amoebiformis TaxID=1561963 RepID=A0A7S0H6J5_9EUKA